MNKLLKRFFTDSRELLYTTDGRNDNKSLSRLAMVFAIFAALGVSIGIPFSGDNAYYIILTISVLFIIYKGGFKISMPFAALYFIILVNVTIVDIPSFFKPFQRAMLFMMLTLVCSSAMPTAAAIIFRRYLFRYIIISMLIISVGSFFCFFLGINLMNIPKQVLDAYGGYESRGGWFSGLTSHSMMLGPISMMSALTFYFIYQKRSNNLYLLLFFMSAMSAVFSASRGSLFALGVAIVFNLIFGKVDARIRKRMIGILAASALLAIPIAGRAFKGVINKQESNEKSGSVFSSRQSKFNYRIEEFKSSPLFGVGFSAIDTTSGDNFLPANGTIEPGSSHLAVLSMTGLTGALAYLFILYKAYCNARSSRSLRSRFVLSCLIALFIHAWFEGYIFAGGNYMALVYWLVIGQCIDSPDIVRALSRGKKRVVGFRHELPRKWADK